MESYNKDFLVLNDVALYSEYRRRMAPKSPSVNDLAKPASVHGFFHPGTQIFETSEKIDFHLY